MHRNWIALLFALSALLGLPYQAKAGPITISTPDFLIPVAGESGVLTVYSDGRAPVTSGFNALASQTFTLDGGAVSSGELILNLVFSGSLLGAPYDDISNALLSLEVTDFDFLTDDITSHVTLNELAVLQKVNGVLLPVADRIKLVDYLPSGAETDDETVLLNSISLTPGPLDLDDYTSELILSLQLTAVAKNEGWSSVTMFNAPESLMSNVSLSLTKVTTTAVPEPSTMLLLGGGLVGVCRRLKKRGSSAPRSMQG